MKNARILIIACTLALNLIAPTILRAKIQEIDSSSPSSRASCPGPLEYTEVWSAEDLAQITNDMLENNSPELKYRQCGDIHLPSEGVLPIGYHPGGQIVIEGFKGEYLGQGFAIIGHAAPSGFTGLFGLFRELDGARISDLEIRSTVYNGMNSSGALASRISGAEIRNIIINDVQLRSTNHDSGALAGLISNSVLEEIIVQGTTGTVGGMARLITSSSLSDINIEVTRDIQSALVRFAGMAERISNSSANRLRVAVHAADSTALQEVAGIALEVATNSLITNVIISNSEFPSTSSYAAGVAARLLGGSTLERLRVYADLASEWRAGGIVARSEAGTIREALFEGAVASGWVAGGIVGSGSVGSISGTLQGTLIERCSVRNSTIEGKAGTGGIAGELLTSFSAPSRVSDSSAEAAVQNNFYLQFESTLAGIIGNSDPLPLQRVLFTGTVEEIAFSGGIIGSPWMEPMVEDGIYNSDLVPAFNGYGTPATQQVMLSDALVYTGFDLMQVWIFDQGYYPELRSIRSLRADADRDFLITQADIFTFLSLYFAMDQDSDFNDDGAINPSDVFSFLSAWFAA